LAVERIRERDAYLLASFVQARTGSSLMARLADAPVATLLEVSGRELVREVGLTPRVAAVVEEVRGGFEPEKDCARLEEFGVSVLTPADHGYPERLAAIADPPPALFVRGRMPAEAAEAACVAVVGSRKASVNGLNAARRLGRRLAERGVCVVSGLALGIDAAAQEGALEAEASGAVTVGVLGCGIDVIYPRSNRALYARTLERGAVVSEYFLGERALPWRFPARNRIIAGISEAVVVVEAAERSGALITARYALDGGRDVWAVPGPLGTAECRGSNRLLSDGAAVLWDVDEFLEAVAPGGSSVAAAHAGAAAGRTDEPAPEVPVGLPVGEAIALGAVGYEPAFADVVAGRSGVSMKELLPALALLELKGYVARDESGAFIRRTVR
jgi:DNA processing protein